MQHVRMHRLFCWEIYPCIRAIRVVNHGEESFIVCCDRPLVGGLTLLFAHAVSSVRGDRK
jgi:hypothetical protein